MCTQEYTVKVNLVAFPTCNIVSAFTSAMLETSLYGHRNDMSIISDFTFAPL